MFLAEDEYVRVKKKWDENYHFYRRYKKKRPHFMCLQRFKMEMRHESRGSTAVTHLEKRC